MTAGARKKPLKHSGARSFGLREKTILLVVMTALIPAVLVATVASRFAGERLRAELDRELRQQSAIASEELQSYFAPVTSGLEILSKTRLAQDILIEDAGGDLVQSFRRFAANLPQVASVAAADSRGKIVSATPPELVGQMIGDRAMRAAVEQGARFVGHIDQSTLPDSSSLNLVVPVHADYDPTLPIGALIAVVRWSAVESQLRDLAIYEHHQDADHLLFVRDRSSGRMLYKTEAVSGTDVDGTLLAQLGNLAHGSTTKVDAHVASTRRLRMSGQPDAPVWDVIIAISEEVAYAPVTRLQQATLFVGALCALIAAVAGWLASNSIVRPVRNMIAAMRAIAKGSSDVPIPGTGRSDELADMAIALEVFRGNLVELRDASERARAGERTKSEFLASISHEIRTPMNGILGMSRLLARTELSDTQRMYCDIVLKSGNALLTIINDVLDFSRIEAGSMQLSPTQFRVREAIEDIATLLAARATEKNIELILKLSPALPDLANGDAGRIRQVLINIVGNAVKFTDAGHILIEATASEDIDGYLLRVEVTDTGIGIPEAKLHAIFDRFNQADGSLARSHEGTGLGLAIARDLVELMDGSISVRSVHGKGSTFCAEMRLGAAEGSSDIEDDRSAAMPAGRVLVVDDNTVTRQVLVEQLVHWGLQATGAPDGKSCIGELARADVQSEPYDVIILDGQMPDLAGLDVASRIQSNPQTAGTPIILMSTIDAPPEDLKLRSRGICFNLIKPMRSMQLRTAVAEALQRGSTLIESESPRSAPARRQASGDLVEGLVSQSLDEVDILLAEDNEMNQILFRHVLGEFGRSFLIVSNGKLAVKAMRELRPKLILMDVSMPVMDGLAATQAIRQIEAEEGRPHTTIIGITAHALDRTHRQCGEAGMDDHLVKPVPPDVLTAMLHKWMGSADEPRSLAG